MTRYKGGDSFCSVTIRKLGVESQPRQARVAQALIEGLYKGEPTWKSASARRATFHFANK